MFTVIDPILFTINLGFIQLPIRWYGIIVVAGVLVATTYAAWYFKRKGEDPNLMWDALIWFLIAGIIGARLWYVINDIIGGGTRYLDNPLSILYINQGGLNILGGLLVGILVGWYYCPQWKMSPEKYGSQEALQKLLDDQADTMAAHHVTVAARVLNIAIR